MRGTTLRRALMTAAALLVVLVGTAAAQTPTPVPSAQQAGLRLAWDHDGIATTGYRLVIDGQAPTEVAATCAVEAATKVRTCAVPFPALTPGEHTIVVVAYNAQASASSEPFAVVVYVDPAKPVNIRIIRTEVR